VAGRPQGQAIRIRRIYESSTGNLCRLRLLYMQSLQIETAVHAMVFEVALLAIKKFAESTTSLLFSSAPIRHYH